MKTTVVEDDLNCWNLASLLAIIHRYSLELLKLILRIFFWSSDQQEKLHNVPCPFSLSPNNFQGHHQQSHICGGSHNRCETTYHTPCRVWQSRGNQSSFHKLNNLDTQEGAKHPFQQTDHISLQYWSQWLRVWGFPKMK